MSAAQQSLPSVRTAWLLWLALAFAGAALALYAVGGHAAAFAPLNALGDHCPDWLLGPATHTGDVLFALSLVLLCARHRAEILWAGMSSAVLAAVVTQGLKSFAQVLRPPAVLAAGSFHRIGPHLDLRSFPSGHTVTAFVAAATLALFVKPAARVPLLALALLVGWTRVAVGVHWPVDVLAGAALGCLCVFAGARLAQRHPWGLPPRNHAILVIVLAGCALAELLRAMDYPHAGTIARPVALLALLLAARELPWREWRGRLAPPLQEMPGAAGSQ